MSTALSIDSRLEQFSYESEKLVERILDIVNDNYKTNNISKVKRGETPIITFVDSEFENVFLELHFNEAELQARIEVLGNDSPVIMNIRLDQYALDKMPKELIEYLEMY